MKGRVMCQHGVRMHHRQHDSGCAMTHSMSSKRFVYKYKSTCCCMTEVALHDESQQ